MRTKPAPTRKDGVEDWEWVYYKSQRTLAVIPEGVPRPLDRSLNRGMSYSDREMIRLIWDSGQYNRRERIDFAYNTLAFYLETHQPYVTVDRRGWTVYRTRRIGIKATRGGRTPNEDKV